MKKLTLLFLIVLISGCTKNFGADLPVFTIKQGGTSTSTSPALNDILIGDGSGKYIVDDIGNYASGGGAAWERIFSSPNTLRPTDTTAGIFVASASSSFNGLRVDGSATTTGVQTV